MIAIRYLLKNKRKSKRNGKIHEKTRRNKKEYEYSITETRSSSFYRSSSSTKIAAAIVFAFRPILLSEINIFESLTLPHPHSRYYNFFPRMKFP